MNYKQFEDKKILITGVGGFIGSATANMILNNSNNSIIYGIDEMNDYYDINIKNNNIHNLHKFNKYNERFIFFQRTIDGNCMNELFNINIRPDYIIHLAARAGVRKSMEEPQLYVTSNINSTIDIFNFAYKCNCKHVIYASSSSVYGKRNNMDSFNENDLTNTPISHYAVTKITTELIAHVYSYNYNIKTTGLRFFTVYGPNSRPDMAPYKFITKILNDEVIDKYGDGTSFRSYTYIDDIVDGILLSVFRCNGDLCEVYNLGNIEQISLNEFISIIEKYIGKKAKINQLDKQLGDVDATIANIDKAKLHFNYNPKISFDEGIEKSIKFFKDVLKN